MKKFFTAIFAMTAVVLSAAQPELKIASYNLRCDSDKKPNNWRSRAPRCLNLLKNEKFDIFGAQEVQQCHIATITAAGYKMAGEARDYTAKTEYSPIFYDPETLTLLNTRTFWLSETPNVPASKSWNTRYPRICTYGIFKHNSTGKKFLFANTHLDHKSADARTNGIKLIVKEISQFPADIPCIVTGDFNASTKNEPYRIISSFMSDARSAAQTVLPGPEQTFHGYVVTPEKRRIKLPIDYIFVKTDHIAVKSFRVIDDLRGKLYSSDHFPVTATIVLK